MKLGGVLGSQRGPSQCKGIAVPGSVAHRDLTPGYTLQDLLLILIQAHGKGGLDTNNLDFVYLDLGHTELIETFFGFGVLPFNHLCHGQVETLCLRGQLFVLLAGFAEVNRCADLLNIVPLTPSTDGCLAVGDL